MSWPEAFFASVAVVSLSAFLAVVMWKFLDG
jgi:hypothetical protein